MTWPSHAQWHHEALENCSVCDDSYLSLDLSSDIKVAFFQS